MLAAIVVAVLLVPVLAGFAPLGGDPQLMYQPIKLELARALVAGRLPFWSDRVGLGAPLIAESHVAALYPPNWLFYRFWNVETAYVLAMWLHFAALAAATYAYARQLGIGRAASVLASVSFTLCGFQAVHAAHEPFYHAMPYVPLCLLLSDRYVATGRLAWLAWLALAWGTQITLGHFQIQLWTAGLVLATGAWRVLAANGRTRRSLNRISGLAAGLCWGAAIALVQLRSTWELSRVAGFVRPSHLLAGFYFPPAHWAQFVLPEVFLGRSGGAGGAYWSRNGTVAGEACAYAGIVPFILAFIGAVSIPRSSALACWRLIVPLSLAVATMPGWLPDGFLMILQVPGLGWFRAPARYTVLTSLGLALLAGRGLDRSVTRRCFRRGLALAIVVGAAGWTWSLYWAYRADFRACIGGDTVFARFAAAALTWGLGLSAIVAWRLNRIGAAAPILITALELGALFFVGPIKWGRPISLPGESTVLRRLAAMPDVGLVAGRLLNLPLDAGQRTAFPYFGIVPPPPNYMLERATIPPAQNDETERRWQRRFGVTHGVWGSKDAVRGTSVLAVLPDPALDRVMATVSISRESGLGPWKLVRIQDTFPAAWVASRVSVAPVWPALFAVLSFTDARDDAWFLADDHPPVLPEPSARVAEVQSWDGRLAVVAHDGSCILILRRTFYPGWFYRVDDGPEQPVLKVDAGLQGALLVGAGTNRVTLRYRPTGLTLALTISLTALAAIAFILSAAAFAHLRARMRIRVRSTQQ
jgi:hypothetical protein